MTALLFEALADFKNQLLVDPADSVQFLALVIV